jgi:hypothetical protein
MINWYCKNYSITKTDCGFWNEKPLDDSEVETTVQSAWSSK